MLFTTFGKIDIDEKNVKEIKKEYDVATIEEAVELFEQYLAEYCNENNISISNAEVVDCIVDEKAKEKDDDDYEDDEDDGEEEDGEDDANESVEKPEPIKTSITTKDLSISESVANVLKTDDSLNESAITELTTLVEAAVVDAVNAKLKELKENYDANLEYEIDQNNQAIEENVSNYLDYAVKEWLKENELVIEKSIQSDLNEEFFVGLQALFSEHYVNVPQDKIDVVESLSDKLVATEDALDEQIKNNIALVETVEEIKKAEIVKDIVAEKNLSDTDTDRLESLAEGLEFTGDEDAFKEKVTSVFEKFTGASDASTKVKTNINEAETDITPVNESSDAKINSYVNFLSRTVQK